MMSKKNKSQFSGMRGFSLVELLVASSIFVTVSVIVISALFATFRLSKKTELVRFLRQSGDSAMTQMVNQILYAASLDDPVSCLTPVTQDSIIITSSSDNVQTTFSCPSNPGDPIASNSASLIDTARVSVDACSFSCTQSSPNRPPTIKIHYELSLIGSSGSSSDKSSFQTTVTMRNYSTR